MSFSSDVKKELCELAVPDRGSLRIWITAILIFGKTINNKKNCLLRTESRAVIDFLIDALEEECPCILSLYTAPNPRKRGCCIYFLFAQSESDYHKICNRFLVALPVLKICLQHNLQKCAAFLRGAFVVCGSIADPHKEYHLEFVGTSYQLTTQLAFIVSSCCNLPLRYVWRRGHHVLYLKESESIEDLLTFMGASRASLSIMSIKVMKDVRNKANRITNCETANIEKTVQTSIRQIEDIQLLQKHEGLNALPEHLQKAARLRLRYPELSLQELAAELGNNVSRSGLNHRFKRISERAKKYRKEI